MTPSNNEVSFFFVETARRMGLFEGKMKLFPAQLCRPRAVGAVGECLFHSLCARDFVLLTDDEWNTRHLKAKAVSSMFRMCIPMRSIICRTSNTQQNEQHIKDVAQQTQGQKALVADTGQMCLTYVWREHNMPLDQVSQQIQMFRTRCSSRSISKSSFGESV